MGIRKALNEIGYYDRLPPEAQAWLETFVRATVFLERDALEALAPNDKVFRCIVYAEDRARRRDLTYVSTRRLHTDETRRRFPRYSPADYGL